MLTFKYFRFIEELILKSSAIIVYRLSCKTLRIISYKFCLQLMILFSFTSAEKNVWKVKS